MRLHFADINPWVTDALRRTFARHPEIEVVTADILAVARHCVVSPANSYGFMDGGVDMAYLRFFGVSIQQVVQDAIARREERLLPVGAALAVHTGHAAIPYMIVAPTMELPEEVPASLPGRAQTGGCTARARRGYLLPWTLHTDGESCAG